MTDKAANPSASDAVDRVFREAYGQAVATLVRVFGDITLAEDAVQDAFVVATNRWRHDGIPPNPAGWIVTTARNRAIDLLRRAARGRELHQEIASGDGEAPNPDSGGSENVDAVTDDRLRLIFTCCHPALRAEHQMALTLRLMGGLSIDELARAFLVNEPAMSKRLVRAKYKIKAANIPYRVPTEADLPDRLQSALSVIYLIYNAGLDRTGRAPLRPEALRLVRALVELMPDEPEVAGLLALLLLTEARASTRIADHSIVLLRDQDRSRWNRDLISEGQDIVRACVRRGQPGLYQLQAAIHAVHCNAARFEDTDWHQIVAIYDHLYALMPTPVVALNRAIAIAEIESPAAALDLIDQIAPSLANYHLMHAARGTYLRQLGHRDAAASAFQRARDLAGTDAERGFLADQVEELTGGIPG